MGKNIKQNAKVHIAKYFRYKDKHDREKRQGYEITLQVKEVNIFVHLGSTRVLLKYTIT